MNVLRRPVLVLNKAWQPVHVATLERAMVLVFKEAAKIVDTTDYQTFTWDDWSQLRPAEGEAQLRGINVTLRVPEVITLTGYDQLPRRSVTFSRRNIFKRDNWRCQYCGKNPGSDELTIDHVLPRSRFGTSTWENCVLACVECNKKKADRTPEEAGMRLRKDPKCPEWRPLYANHNVRLKSWEKFISEVYWNAELKK